jgi:hypothetical protein
MHPDVHLVRTRPPILDAPPLVWIDPPGRAEDVRAGQRAVMGMVRTAAAP